MPGFALGVVLRWALSQSRALHATLSDRQSIESQQLVFIIGYSQCPVDIPCCLAGDVSACCANICRSDAALPAAGAHAGGHGAPNALPDVPLMPCQMCPRERAWQSGSSRRAVCVRGLPFIDSTSGSRRRGLQMCLGALLQFRRTISRLGLGSTATVSKSTLTPDSEGRFAVVMCG